MAETPINADSSNPLHVQVSDFIRNKIYSQEWDAGTRIPSEHELMKMLGVSRGTVQKGIKSLVKEGLLTQTRGKGAFVTEPVLQYPTSSSLLSYAESLRLQGVEFKTEVLRHDIVSADAACSNVLNIPRNAPVLLLVRLRSSDGEPLLLMESRISLLACPGIDGVDFTKETLFTAMEKFSGHKIGYAKAQYGARVAGEERGSILHCDKNAPVLNVHQVVYLQTNVATEWSNLWLPANKYVFTSVLQRY